MAEKCNACGRDCNCSPVRVANLVALEIPEFISEPWAGLRPGMVMQEPSTEPGFVGIRRRQEGGAIALLMETSDIASLAWIPHLTRLICKNVPGGRFCFVYTAEPNDKDWPQLQSKKKKSDPTWKPERCEMVWGGQKAERLLAVLLRKGETGSNVPLRIQELKLDGVVRNGIILPYAPEENAAK